MKDYHHPPILTSKPGRSLSSRSRYVSLCLGTFLVALDVNIIGVAVPKIAAVFTSLDDIAWYGSAYLLTITAFQPIMGFVYKYFDVKTAYLSSIVIFEGMTRRELCLTDFSCTAESEIDC